MRADMHKVLVEEGRGGGANRKTVRRKGEPEEHLPSKEGMRRPYKFRKWFGEHLGPLKRWLRSNVGRPWNDVYSEASWIMKPSNVVRAHIRFHMLEMVERNTILKEGGVWYFGSGGLPVKLNEKIRYSAWPHFYVHPKSGLLLEGGPKHWHPGWRSKPKPMFEHKWMARNQAFVKIDGFWFDCDFAEFPPEFKRGDSPLRFDVGVSRNLSRAEAEKHYGKRMFCVRKQQLSRKELRQNGLVNDRNAGDRHSAPPGVVADFSAHGAQLFWRAAV